MEFKCNLFQEGKPSVNGRTYSKESLERVAKQSSGLSIQLGKDSEYNPLNCVGIISHCDVKDGFLVAEAKMLDTESGKLTQSLINAGFDLGSALMPRLIAELDKDGNPIAETIQTIGYSLNFPLPME